MKSQRPSVNRKKPTETHLAQGLAIPLCILEREDARDLMWMHDLRDKVKLKCIQGFTNHIAFLSGKIVCIEYNTIRCFE